MGGSGGTPDLKDPAGIGGSRTGLEGGGKAISLPEWAAGDTMGSWLTRSFPGVQMNDKNVAEASAGTTGIPAGAPSTALGFPSAAPTSRAAPPAAAAAVRHVGAPAPVAPPVAAAAGPAQPTTSPDDWLYPGNLPMTFNGPGEFGKPVPYAATGANYTAGYGAAGNFGGQAGYGPPQKGLQDRVLLPEMAAGTKLEGADIDQRNRVRRADYDRYMGLYGVGYDLPAYQQALNSQVAPSNFLLNAGGPGG